MGSLLQQLSVWVLPVLVAVILHEISHGVVANWCGDSTAKDRGRLTLNPLPHIDPIGTIALPGLLLLTHAPFVFGYARPVPVNFANLRNPKRDMVLVAAAGPLTNMILAVASVMALRLLIGWHVSPHAASVQMFKNSVEMNVVLGVFNLMPILPLDGGRVLAGLLPRRQALAFARLEPFGMVIVVMLMATNVMGQVVGPVVNAFLHVLQLLL